MELAQFTVGEWFLLAQYELLLLAAVFFAFGVIDELAIDLIYFWLRLTGQVDDTRVDEAAQQRHTLAGPAAVFIPAWDESEVIGATVAHLLAAWPYENLTLYIGCYRNDSRTVESALLAAGGDDRVRIVVHDTDGPTSKAHCLNLLYSALGEDEVRSGETARMVVLHDAEDMVDQAALSVLDEAIEKADFIQLPVLALPQSKSRFIGSHYTDEFAEAHGKTMIVRNWLGAAVPGAGVGSAIARHVLEKLGDEPFARQSLTEDYELGLRTARVGFRTRFLPCRTTNGRLIATRAFFPSTLHDAVRQKTRWMHGIALQSWDRLGWNGSWPNLWMQLRDRRGPLAAILMATGYLLVVTSIIALSAFELGLAKPVPLTPLMTFLLTFNLLGFAWRMIMRACFTGREYGWRQGLLAIPRTFVSNAIAILAGRRALVAYIRTLRGSPVVWDKTHHRDHPVLMKVDENRA